MKRKSAITLIIIASILLFLCLWPIAIPLLIIGIFFLYKSSNTRNEEQERQRDIERKEIDMVRKSNEILLHLIQDEHRDEGR